MSFARSQGSLPNASIRMEYTLDGKEVVFEGTARFIEMDTQVEYDDVRSLYSQDVISRYASASSTKLTAELIDGWKVTVSEPVEVEINMQARLDVLDRTVDEFEKARVQCGAPKKAKMRFLPNLARNDEGIVLNLDTPQPGTVEFVWKKKVRKSNG